MYVKNIIKGKNIMNEKNIYQRINAVMKKVKYVKKDANVQGYKAVTHDQVVSVARQALVDEGVVIVPCQNSSIILQPKNSENKMCLYEAQYCITFVNVDKPDDLIRIVVTSHAQDNGDKAPGKALSYATKYAILKLLCLETGENDESRSEVNATLTPMQAKGVRALIGDDTDLEIRMLAHLQVESVEEILKSDYNKVVAQLKKAKANANN